MYSINIICSFSGAHKLVGYQGTCAELHGHNWKVRLMLCCLETDAIGITIDFKLLKKKFEQILSEFDHKYLNELDCFSGKNPTSELIAKVLFEKASTKINDLNCKVKEIEVWESEKYSVLYTSDENS